MSDRFNIYDEYNWNKLYKSVDRSWINRCPKEDYGEILLKNVKHTRPYFRRNYDWFMVIYHKFKRMKCEICGRLGCDVDLMFHHIIELENGGKSEQKNLMLLCGKCHKKIHGNKDHTERIILGKQWYNRWVNGETQTHIAKSEGVSRNTVYNCIKLYLKEVTENDLHSDTISQRVKTA